ncbi:MAG TPA: hypothetical protein VHX88_21930 [Solirubrobacteraceae bacterium]|nr:hypothetical protein [Solirubrobacteraceae bacterium]
MNDSELRDNLFSAYESARVAFQRLNNGKGPTKALLEDKKLQRELAAGAAALRSAADALIEPAPSTKRRGGLGRLILLATVGGIAALVLSEGARSKLLDALFGKEEEFDYTSTTAPVSVPASDAVGASAN